MKSKFRVRKPEFWVLRFARILGLEIRRLLLFALNSLLLTLSSPLSFADVYAPADSIALTVGCLDTTFLGIADPDSVWFKWWRDVNGQTIIDSAKVISSLRTGFIRYKIKASDGSNNLGTYIAEAIVYKDGKTGIKSWSWTVKAEFDSITNAIKDVNKDNFKATVVKVDGGYVGQCTTLVDPAKVTGGYVGQCTTVINEVNLVSTDTVKAEVLDKTGFSLTPEERGSIEDSIHDNANDYKADVSNLDIAVSTRLAKGDSSLYMRTDWANIKNVTTYQYFSQTRLHFVDSLGQEIAAQADTEAIARYNWNYEARTLTSGAGSGANSVVIRCKQSSDSSNIALAFIQVTDSVENSTIGLLTSDSQGRGFFALDNGTYCVRMYKPGWQFTVPETLKVSGDEDTTYYADAFDPGSPPQPSLCRVHGWVYDINNQPEVGAKIEASIRTIPLRYQNVIVSPYYKSTTTDEEGYWYLDLYPNSLLSPSDTKYVFFIYNPSGTILRIETTVPDQGSWELQW
ncbi:MAG: hypothetical protein ACE5KJ_02005 [Candidatus Zixiibacteriota bacterium]